jgi:hypothetical protein
MPSRSTLPLVALLILVIGMLAGCQALPPIIAPTLAATEPPTPEPTATPPATPRPTPSPSPTPAPTLRPGEPPVLALIPLALGASWTYSVTLDYQAGFSVAHWSGVVTETLSEATRQGDAQVFRAETTGALPLDTPPYEALRYYVALDETLYHLFESLDPAELIRAQGKGFEGEQIAKWPLRVGQTWGDPDLGGIHGTMYRWVVEAEEEQRTPAGTFLSCYRVVYRTNPDVTMRWYCPGVGLVRYQYHHNGTRHDETWELLSYQSSQR